jgi:phage portal protein BeeE
VAARVVRLVDRVRDRYRQQGYYEGMASGAAVLTTYGGDPRREIPAQNLVAAARQAYATNGVVFACIMARQMLLSEATFKLRVKSDKSTYGNEDLRILEYPWQNGTTGDLWTRMELDDSTAGTAFIAKVEDDTLLRLPPHETTIVSEEVTATTGTKYRQILGYDWDPDKMNASPGQPSSRAQFFTVDEVAQWSPFPDPGANFRGWSWLTPVLRDIGADSGMTQYKVQYMDHGTPVVAVKYPMKLRPETIDSIVERMEAKFGGVGNAFKTLVFDQGADPTLGNSFQDMAYTAVQEAGEARICSAAGVPPRLLGLAGGPEQSDAEAMRRFADLTIRPLWRSGCAALQKLVPNVPAKGVQLWFDTSDIAALQAAETEKAQVTQVNAAALFTLTQSGFTRESSIAYVSSGDVTQLVPDPNAPTPGVSERETITAAESAPVTGPDSANGKTGVPPGGPQAVLTKPQTPASKKPMPASFPTPALAGHGTSTPPSANGRH